MVVLLRRIMLILLVSSILILVVTLLGRMTTTEAEIDYQVWNVEIFTHYIRDVKRDFNITLAGTRCFDRLPAQYAGIEIWLDQTHFDQPQEAVAAIKC